MELITDPLNMWFDKKTDPYTGIGMTDEVVDETGEVLSAEVGHFTDCYGYKREFFDSLINFCRENNLNPVIASTRIQDFGKFMEKKILDLPFFKNNPEYRGKIDGEKRIKNSNNKKGEVWYGIRLKRDPETLKREIKERNANIKEDMEKTDAILAKNKRDRQINPY